jgi:hypothetical protein
MEQIPGCTDRGAAAGCSALGALIVGLESELQAWPFRQRPIRTRTFNALDLHLHVVLNHPAGRPR